MDSLNESVTCKIMEIQKNDTRAVENICSLQEDKRNRKQLPLEIESILEILPSACLIFCATAWCFLGFGTFSGVNIFLNKNWDVGTELQQLH